MIIDAHQHFWKYNAVNHSWIDESMAIIRKDFMPTDLEKVYQTNDIDGCVAVQADQTLEETDFLLKLANENNMTLLSLLIYKRLAWSKVQYRSPVILAYRFSLSRYRITNYHFLGEIIEGVINLNIHIVFTPLSIL